MTEPPRAALSLEGRLGGRAGADRIALLEAVDSTGSITAAAKRVGLSYRAAWDAVQVLNNLFAGPLVAAGPGGAKGGGAELTPLGRQVVKAFGIMEDGVRRMFGELQDRMSDADGPALSSLMWGFGMKLSTPNALRGVVSRITDGAVNAEVLLRIGQTAEIVAVVTRRSVEDLELAVGREAVALINAGSIILAPLGEEILRTSARNALAGTVVAHQSGAVNDEIQIEIDDGKILTATVTSESAQRLGLEPGARVIALIKASHVILAVN